LVDGSCAIECTNYFWESNKSEWFWRDAIDSKACSATERSRGLWYHFNLWWGVSGCTAIRQ
jgi:hypothetical protein